MQTKNIAKFFTTTILAATGFLLVACDNHVQEVNDHISVVLDEAEQYVEQARIPYAPESTDKR